ncbi:CRAL/TRIO domain-containing protein [Zopfia rhizophila CBS 207.26]|uniref:CRAL/TRIO domain-containing protein n=1 Tax=Zopfia rhizophila CBS 207.26 TaxID=1314779 RepID=A0A6A6D816_9PEZI|nr:CRAL/TRIO domain-containing protein [Zopfia rhizophila CBS 207.26]
MAPNMPPGRPGTLTPEEEGKLRELWVVTMKVFGVYEPAAPETNGTATPLSPSSDTTEADGRKDKKKSRLNIFRRHKGDKDTEPGSTPPSGTATPSDISSLSIADEDDKHGQTKDFKAALANKAPEDLRKAFWSMVKHDHPDALLLHFLRARKWDAERALVMLISTMHWRAEEMHVDDDIIWRGELAALEDSKSDDPKVKKEGDDFLAQMRMGKSFLHGVDKEGRPMCIVRVRLHRQGEQSEQSLERFTVYTIETARMLLRPPVDTATVIFDMTNFSMANMDYTPVKFMIKCFEANYPESLGAVLVHKAPWVFNAIWTIIRGWLDPVVAGKVHFTKNVEELEAFIPKSQIPTELGGDEDWTYSYIEPDPKENSLLSDEEAREGLKEERSELVRKYESTVLEWIHAEGKEEREKTKSLEERRRERDTVAEQLRTNYWKLDPYLRARTLYDRTGVIGEAGKLEFYPKKEKVTPTAPPPQATAAAPETSPDDVD